MGEKVGQIAKVPEVKQSSSNSRVRRTERLQSMDTPVDRILFLQRTAGNQAVSRLMRSGALRAKLRIGQPGDVYEQEADRVADAVMRMSEPGVQRQVEPEEGEEEMLQAKPLAEEITPLVQVQRQEEPEEEEETLQAKPLAEEIIPLVQRQVEPEEEEEEEIRPKSIDGAAPEVTPEIGRDVQSIKGRGQPLSASERAFFEPRYGADFDDVRVHSDARAAHVAQSVNARAFTHGRDVVFGAGQYAPGMSEGRRLLAHELTHVVQQSAYPTNQLSLVQRLEAMQNYRGCHDDQNFFTELAQTRASVWVACTISALEEIFRPHDIVTLAESTLNRFFHPPRGRGGTIGGYHHPRIIRTIIRRLRRIMRALDNPRLFRCVTRRTCGRENADNDPNALAYAGQWTVISLCPNFFNLSPTDQIGTFIHESAHHIGLMRNVIERERVMGLSLSQSLNNAESYSLLVIENFIGPPIPPQRPPPTQLTESWSPAYMSSELFLSEPERGLFYEGRGRRRLLSSLRPSIEAPFLSTQPIHFRGQVRFYVDSDDIPKPTNIELPDVNVQILFDPFDGPTTEQYVHNDSNPEYMEAGLPLLLSFSPDFDFTIRRNGRLRFTLWQGIDLCALYDDTIRVKPQNDI